MVVVLSVGERGWTWEGFGLEVAVDFGRLAEGGVCGGERWVALVVDGDAAVVVAVAMVGVGMEMEERREIGAEELWSDKRLELDCEVGMCCWCGADVVTG